MKVLHVRWLLIGLVALWFVLTYAFPPEGGTIGLSGSYANGEYQFAGGTQPAALCFAVLMIISYILLIKSEQNVGKPVEGVLRRFVAFWLDLIVAISILAPILGIVPTILEWRRTGEFQWTFERSTSASGDALQLALLLPLSFAALALYHALPLLYSRPTPGACIMGYRVVSDEGKMLTLQRALFRTLMGFIAACAAYLAPFIGRDRRKGKFWLDQMFDTHAVGLR
jgi:uncharacterized RDD family membrane protein YckC